MMDFLIKILNFVGVLCGVIAFSIIMYAMTVDTCQKNKTVCLSCAGDK